MLDTSLIGLETAPRSVAVEPGQLRFFAKAVDETDPVYFDEDAAKAQGHPSLLAPPTFLMCLSSLAPDREDAMARMNIDIGQILHGEQHFTPRAAIHAGDVITLTTRVMDIYEKKGGALGFIVQETRAVNQRGDAVGEMQATIVVRGG